MELHKVPVAEMRGFDKGRLKELRHEIQRELVKLRMDVYSARAQHSARVRGLRKTLARLLTVTRLNRPAVTPKAATAPVPAKPATPKAKTTAAKSPAASKAKGKDASAPAKAKASESASKAKSKR